MDLLRLLPKPLLRLLEPTPTGVAIDRAVKRRLRILFGGLCAATAGALVGVAVGVIARLILL